MEFAEAYAGVLVEENWQAIERVVKALIERQKLTYAEVVAILAANEAGS